MAGPRDSTDSDGDGLPGPQGSRAGQDEREAFGVRALQFSAALPAPTTRTPGPDHPPSPKAALKRTHSKRWRDLQSAAPKHAPPLDCARLAKD
jgi:hypothetical protein